VVTQNLPPEFYLNQANGLGSSSACIHTDIFPTPFGTTQGTSRIMGDTKYVNWFFSGPQYFHYTTYLVKIRQNFLTMHRKHVSYKIICRLFSSFAGTIYEGRVNWDDFFWEVKSVILRVGMTGDLGDGGLSDSNKSKLLTILTRRPPVAWAPSRGLSVVNHLVWVGSRS